MEKIKKILLALATLTITLIANFLGVVNSVYAAELGGNIQLNNLGDCGALLTYKGSRVITAYVTYNDGGVEYPAYCLNSKLAGIGMVDAYSVSINDYVTDVGLWRRMINGYPYKTIGELGCQTREEAFSATKQAIYCYIHGNNPDDYGAIGETGQRTLNAMKLIIANAQNSKETIMHSTININKIESTWKEDNIDKKYVSKVYSVEANSDYKNYTISIEKVGNIGLPEGIKITNVNNKEQNTFAKGEKFKVMIPIRNLSNNGDFTLNIKSELNTKPILYGKAPNTSLQDYALTSLRYEEGKSAIQDSYGENKTKINVLKQDKNTQKPLEGVMFDLLDENKQVVKSGLKTDENGKITIDKIMPGKYYLVETSTLDGYVKYDDEIEINVELNEEYNVTVNNSKETKIEVENTKKEESVSQKIEKVTAVKKLPVTGM